MDDDPFGIFSLSLCSYFYDRGNTRDHLRMLKMKRGFAGFAGVLR